MKYVEKYVNWVKTFKNPPAVFFGSLLIAFVFFYAAVHTLASILGIAGC
jgi:hypothetical protein